MAGGPIFPYSAVGDTKCFPFTYIGSGPGQRVEDVLGVLNPDGVNRTWQLRYQLPPVLPDGTAYLYIKALSIATTGSAKVNPKWICAGSFHDPSSFTLAAEGTTTVTWTGSASHRYLETKIALDVSSLFANASLVMDLVFETSGWTVTPVIGVIPTIIWE